MARPLFPPTIDSTLLAAFRSCPQKAFRTYVEHWKPQNESVHLIAGGAFAKGIEVAREAFFVHSMSREDSEQEGLKALLLAYGDFEPPEGTSKTPDRVAGALEFYFQGYPLGVDKATPIHLPNGKRGIEMNFAEPMDVRHPVSGDPLLYTGRMDMVADFAGGIYGYDEKTTSSLGASWGKQWEMRSQFTGYMWALRRAGIKAQGMIVRGVSILKTKFDTMEVITYRSQYEIDRWEEQTRRDVERMIQCWKDGYWDWDLDHACAEYGGCSMTSVCKSNDPEAWLPMYFQKRVWNPLARKEESVEEWEASWPGCKEPE